MFLSELGKSMVTADIALATSLPVCLASMVFGYQHREAIYSTKRAFAAKLADGRVVTWGNAADGGDSSNVQELEEYCWRGSKGVSPGLSQVRGRL